MNFPRFCKEILAESKEIKPNNNVVAIDIGVNNLMSITDNIGNVPIIINGKP